MIGCVKDYTRWLALEKGYKRLTLEMRYKIKELRDQRYSIRKIAEIIGVSPATVHYELGRARDGSYDPEYAEMQYRVNRQALGREAIIASNKELAEYISQKILDGHSPEKIAEMLKNGAAIDKGQLETVSVNTIYRAIDTGLIPGVTRGDLRLRETKMFSNGMVCIPKWIRDLWGLRDGDIFHITLSDQGDIILKKKD